MYKQVIRPMLCAILVFCIALGFQTNALATKSITVDNTSSGSTFFPTTGFKSIRDDYKQLNGTSAYQVKGTGSDYFSYNAPIKFTGTLHIQVYAYLWCDLFENEQTMYYANVFNTYAIRGDLYSPLNQKSAMAGWNVVNSTPFAIDDYYDFYGISVKSSKDYTTGADAIMIVYWVD